MPARAFGAPHVGNVARLVGAAIQTAQMPLPEPLPPVRSASRDPSLSPPPPPPSRAGARAGRAASSPARRPARRVRARRPIRVSSSLHRERVRSARGALRVAAPARRAQAARPADAGSPTSADRAASGRLPTAGPPRTDRAALPRAPADRRPGAAPPPPGARRRCARRAAHAGSDVGLARPAPPGTRPRRVGSGPKASRLPAGAAGRPFARSASHARIERDERGGRRRGTTRATLRQPDEFARLG